MYPDELTINPFDTMPPFEEAQQQSELLSALQGQLMQQSMPTPQDLAQALQMRGEFQQAHSSSAPNLMPSQDPGQYNQADLNTIMNTGGYAGPLRPDEIAGKPGVQRDPMQQYQHDELQRLRGMELPGMGNAGQFMDMQNVIKGLPPALQSSVMQLMFPNLPTSAQQDSQKSYQDFLQRLQIERERNDAMMGRTEAQVAGKLAGAKPSLIPAGIAQRQLSALADKVDPATLQALAQSMGYPGATITKDPGWIFDKTNATLQAPQRASGQAPAASGMPPPPSAPMPGQKLPPALARQYVEASGGDVKAAMRAAQAAGWDIRK